jgi:hypothetical protein
VPTNLNSIAGAGLYSLDAVLRQQQFGLYVLRDMSAVKQMLSSTTSREMTVATWWSRSSRDRRPRWSSARSRGRRRCRLSRNGKKRASAPGSRSSPLPRSESGEAGRPKLRFFLAGGKNGRAGASGRPLVHFSETEILASVCESGSALARGRIVMKRGVLDGYLSFIGDFGG